MRYKSHFWIVALLGLLLLVSCSAHSNRTTIKTVTTTTVECEVPPESTGEEELPDTRECTTIEEETKVSKVPSECHGILSCSFFVTGEVIALPFRALGAALDIVF